MSRPVIMVVDDQATIRNVIVSMLQSIYDVRACDSGHNALSYLATNTVDMVLLDYEMPGMTGFEVLLALRSDERTSDVPVIFLTALTDERVEAEMLERGAADYLHKPFRAPVLLSRIKTQLDLCVYRKHMEKLVMEQTEGLRQAYEKLKQRDAFSIHMLAQVTDLRDHGTGDHIRRATEYVRIIVQDLYDYPHPNYELTIEQATNIIESSKLHDVGKIGVPDHILMKPGKLTPEEFEKIKTHPDHGARLLDEFIDQLGRDAFFVTARDIALCHHEKWNGEGYPQHLKGTEIPLSARIVALADAYDAIRSVRPYKTTLGHDQAAQIIICEAGTHFDPYLVEVFARHEDEYAAVKY